MSWLIDLMDLGSDCVILVMRKEAVYSLLLNVTLFKGMKCTIAQDPRYVRFSTIESGTTVHYNIRVSMNITFYFLQSLIFLLLRYPTPRLRMNYWRRYILIPPQTNHIASCNIILLKVKRSLAICFLPILFKTF